MPTTYSYIEHDVKDDDDDWKYDSLIEYRTEDFKEFSKLVDDLSQFRKQMRDIKKIYRLKQSEVEGIYHSLSGIENISRYIDGDPVWLEKVKDLKTYFLEKTKYDDLKLELSRLEEQKCQVESIQNEFKIQECSGICCVCSEKSVTQFLDPCGHVLCEECLSKIVSSRASRCPMCRTNFTPKKIYLV